MPSARRRPADVGPYRIATYFDRNYLVRGIALHASLVRHVPSVQVTALALDEDAAAALEGLALPSLTVLRLEELEAYDPELAATRADRRARDYVSTLRPAYMQMLLDALADDDVLTYMDADLFCFNDARGGLDAIEGHSAALTPHGPPPPGIDASWSGRFNAGWVAVRRDATGRACIARWREDCLALCRIDEAARLIGNQRYLDAWPERFPHVLAIDDPGVNAGPWNLCVETVRDVDGAPYLGERPLQTYHFHGLRHVRPGIYRPGAANYGVRLSRRVVRLIHEPYLRALQEARARLGDDAPDMLARMEGSGRARSRREARGLRAWAHRLRDGRRVRRGHYLRGP